MGAKPRAPRLPRFELTDELRLRPLRASDQAPLFKLVDANRARLAQWFDWEEHTQTEADLAVFLTHVAGAHLAGTGLHCAVIFRGGLAGTVSLDDIRPRGRSATFGYWLDAAAEGQGVMSTAVSALTAYAFDTLDLHRIELQAATNNHRSRAVAERLGFQCEGTLRDKAWVRGGFLDHALYALLAPAWRARAASRRG